MELVDGKNLRQLLNRFRELGQSFPVELAAHIVERIRPRIIKNNPSHLCVVKRNLHKIIEFLCKLAESRGAQYDTLAKL